MIYSEVIIVGGGPAGSTCGWKLRQNAIECLILDKQEFPRTKLCAGWITPAVINDLQIDPNDYPHSLIKFDRFRIHVYDKQLDVKVHQYAIRRYEFDHWLLKRSGVSVNTHEVSYIKKDGDYYIIDDQYRCRYLVGAGGTHCPVCRTFFKDVNPRAKDLLVVTLEEEFPYEYQDGNCHLWFLQNKLPGYSWYVPKSNGYLNIGIGGFSEKLKANNDSIRNQWEFFTKELERLSLVKDYHFSPKGYIYYIRDNVDTVQIDNSFLIGDAAGLATKDMGEGIGPAVKSGILAAEAITSGKTLSLNSIKKHSFTKYRTFIKVLLAYFFNQRDNI
jgi:flavin-dependent dehydrogenase